MQLKLALALTTVGYAQKANESDVRSSTRSVSPDHDISTVSSQFNIAEDSTSQHPLHPTNYGGSPNLLNSERPRFSETLPCCIESNELIAMLETEAVSPSAAWLCTDAEGMKSITGNFMSDAFSKVHDFYEQNFDNIACTEGQLDSLNKSAIGDAVSAGFEKFCGAGAAGHSHAQVGHSSEHMPNGPQTEMLTPTNEWKDFTKNSPAELDKWYENTAVPYAKVWQWSKERLQRAQDLAWKNKDEDTANAAKKLYAELLGGFRQTKDVIDQRRLSEKKFIRFVLSEGEWDRVHKNYMHLMQDAIRKVENRAKNNPEWMCHFDSEDAEYFKEVDRYDEFFTQWISHGSTDPNGVVVEGDPTDPAVDKAQKQEIFNIFNYVLYIWQIIDENYVECAKNTHEHYGVDDASKITNSADRERVQTMEAEHADLMGLLVNQDKHHSVFCHVNVLLKIATYSNFFPNAAIDDIRDVCEAAADEAGHHDFTEQVEHFAEDLNLWKTADDQLYLNSLKNDRKKGVFFMHEHNLSHYAHEYFNESDKDDDADAWELVDECLAGARRVQRAHTQTYRTGYADW
jgi:hypothetical protein